MVSINDIFNRPPTISEDTLQYILYLPPDQSDRVSATTLAALLTEDAQLFLPEHLWHRDAFEMKVVPDPEGRKDIWVLEGRMRVGDCIDDEWATVWLLRELGRKWDVVISVFDSDGEFLLIEAAEELPSWVTPTNAENRVWIHNSRLHIVPLSHTSPPSSKKSRRRYPSHHGGDEDSGNDQEQEEEEFISAADAVKLVRDPSVDTHAPEKVQGIAWKRIQGYPAASRQHMHVAKAYLPLDVAKALVVNPLLVQKAVEIFYTRDALQLRAAQKMARFSPQPEVLSSVKMTRTAYAQLVGQRFHSPKAFGSWAEREGTKEWRWRDIGMKIACGFEMLYQEGKNKKESLSAHFDGSSVSLDALKDSLRRNPEYPQYIRRLVFAGYFKGELEGSQLWRALENQAAASFVTARRDDDASRPSFATAVQAALAQHSDAGGIPADEEDSEEWLNVDATDFEAMLERTVGSAQGKEKASDAMNVDPAEDEEDCIAKAQAARLKELARKVEQFVEGEGDVEGARFADEEFSDEGDSDDDYALHEDESDAEDMDEEVPAQTSPAPRAQLTGEQRAARRAAMDNLVPGLDPSEYGKMPPSFHSNSQRVAPVTVETEMRENLILGDAMKKAPEHRPRPIRPPILPRDHFDGVDSDDETDEDTANEEEEEEDNPQIVGEVEIDMAEEEDEFIEFARQALGVTDDQWNSILNERRGRGAFVPSHVNSGNSRSSLGPSSNGSSPSRGERSNTLDSFEAVMKAMDAELARARGATSSVTGHDTATTSKAKGKTRSCEPVDIEETMEAELRAMMERDEVQEEEEDVSGHPDYQLIKNFLESYKSQGGLSGPVSNLVGRLHDGWTLPRDAS